MPLRIHDVTLLTTCNAMYLLIVFDVCRLTLHRCSCALRMQMAEQLQGMPARTAQRWRISRV